MAFLGMQVGNADLCPDGVGTSAWAGVVDHNPMDLSLYTSAAWTVLSSIQDGVSVHASGALAARDGR